ncbi:RnfABCDGE type electron transport complex subunit D [Halioxenophilus sp. WMMB6]|uniref:RnfABCDGE type electron transport complex subunit D n=1 Tax=Halioxenophilus sp. WMMB6 TaxID=3073815 RepID=UPI00295F17D7|nr:RnfABCDGE type electron transport complex subunit D [Halioxenophilus sp. WMMB6]
MALLTISSPHAHDHSSVSRVMLHVCLALVPATALGFYLFGLPAILMFLLTVGSAILWESVCLKLMGRSQSRLWDGSAMLTGWLLALSLPPWAPWWLALGGTFVAIVIGKQLYGGLGQNIFNPAMLARVALLISFPLQMTTWALPLDSFTDVGIGQSFSIIFGGAPLADGMTGATALGHLKTELSTGADAQQVLAESFSASRAILGTTGGSLGETSALLLLLGGAWLLIMRIISWHIPVSMMASVVIMAAIFHWIDPSRYGGGIFHLLSGGMVLGAFFIATDLVTSPSSKSGQLVFGAGCGIVDFIIRTWGGFPEGMGFAVLFMNALTPLIDLYFKPRVYGRRIDGTPKRYAKE